MLQINGGGNPQSSLDLCCGILNPPAHRRVPSIDILLKQEFLFRHQDTNGLIDESDHDTMKTSTLVFTLLSLTVGGIALSNQYETEPFPPLYFPTQTLPPGIVTVN